MMYSYVVPDQDQFQVWREAEVKRRSVDSSESEGVRESGTPIVQDGDAPELRPIRAFREKVGAVTNLHTQKARIS
jgi:hypothetical protein